MTRMIRGETPKRLFSEVDLRNFIRSERERMLQKVDAYESQYVLSLNTDAVCEELYKKYEHKSPTLRTDGIYIKDSGERDKGTFVTFAVPFEGDPYLFSLRPSTFYPNVIHGTIGEEELLLSYFRTDHDPEAIKAEFKNDIQTVQQNLESVAKDISPYNAEIKQVALKRIQTRREKLQKDQKMVEALGFPTKKPNK